MDKLVVNSPATFFVIGVLLMFVAMFYGGGDIVHEPIVRAGAVPGFALAGGMCFIASALSQRKDRV